MVKKINNNIDYSLILQAISSYLVGAKDFFGNEKNKFSVGLIPDGHHIYTGTLKAVGYRLLKPSKTLILIGEGAINNKVCILNRSIDFFMGKERSLDKKIFSLLKGHDFVDLVDHEFDRISSELPFLRIISDYDNIVFMEIGDKVSKIKLTNLLSQFSDHANLMFISDFHRDKTMKVCKEMDNQILDLDFVKKDKELFLIELFLRIAKKQSKTPSLSAYLNTGDISTDKKITNGFGCIVL